MFNIFTTIKSIYKKQNLDISEAEMFHGVAIGKWLSYDTDNMKVLEECSKYFFYLTPELYLKLLYLCIPKKEQPPFLHKVEKETKKENQLYESIRVALRWTDRELKLHSRLLDKIIDSKYWKQQLGI
jgi:hypothetical protein